MTTAIAGFAFERRIGIGAMGEVWRARAPDGTSVAVKVARNEIQDPRLQALITAEARVLAKLDHPQVAWLYDHGRMPAGTPFPVGCPYIVLEHCGEGTLANRRPTDWATTRPIVTGLLRALGHAHAHGIIHRDLKPANILWSGPADIRPGMKLADFGVAWSMGTGENPGRAGTPVYMAPEQGRTSGVPIGPYTDLYALGVVVWELVTGRLPWDGPTPIAILAASLAGPPPFVPRFAVPDGFDGWLERLLDSEPRRRTGNAADALRALAAIDPEVEPTGSGWQTAPRVGPRLRLQGAGLGMLALREPELAGRGTERAALWDALETARSERTLQVAILRGSSGIGKTRLCRWIAERAAELGLAEPVVVACQDDATLPRLLTALFRIEEVGPKRPAAIRAALEAHGPTTAARLDPLLADPAGPWGGVPVVLELLRDEASSQPRILILDDAHQCVNAVRLAAALAAEQRAVPILVVIAVQDEGLGREPAIEALLNALARAPRVQVLPLGPLSAPDQEELVRTLVGLDPESHADVLARAGGHPGHAVDQVTRWAREGVLAPGRRGFQRVGVASPAGGSWTSLWAERLVAWLQPLDLEDQVLLERAAVVGRAVDDAMWAAACDDPEGTRGVDSVRVVREAARRRANLVDRLVTAGLAEETDEGFTFTHPAVVDLLVARARDAGRLREHHRTCANQLRRSTSPGSALRLGRHLAEAELWDEAVSELIRGILHAWRGQDRRPLLSDLGTAGSCADRAGWALDDPRRWELHHLRALLLLTAGRTDEAAAEGLQAWTLAVKSGSRAAVAATLLRRIDVLFAANRTEEAAALIPAFLEVEDASSHPHWPGIVRVRYAKRMKQLGQTEGALRWFARAEKILLATAGGSCAAFGALLELYSSRGDMGLDDARRDLERILEIGPTMESLAADRGETDMRVLAASMQTEAARSLGRHAEAIEAGERSLRICAQIGDDRFMMFMRLQLASIDLMEGRHAGALQRLDLAREASDRVQNAWLLGVLSLERVYCHVHMRDRGAFDREVPELDARFVRLVAADPALVERLEGLVSALHDQGERARAATLERVLDRTRRAPRP